MRAALLALLVALAAALPARAEDEDRLAPIRDEVVRLEAEGRLESALVLLRGVKEETLDPGARLERAQRIDALSTKQIERYADDRTQAAALEKQGKLPDAAKALDLVERYGSAKQVEEAKADRARLLAAAEKADQRSAEEAKAKAQDEAKKRAAASTKDKEEAQKAIKRWLDARRQLTCSRCSGKKELSCSSCEGSGKVKVLHAAPAPGSAPSISYQDCGKCGGDGRVRCPPDSCGGSGFNRAKARLVLWEAFPKDFRGALEKKGLNEKRFLDGLRSWKMGEPAPPDVATCAGVLPNILDTVRAFDSLEVAVDDEGSATARYFVKLPMDGYMEESRWKRVDAVWFLVPPNLDAPPAVKRKPAPGKPGGAPAEPAPGVPEPAEPPPGPEKDGGGE